MGLEEQRIDRSRYLVIPRTLIFIFNREHVLLIKGAPDKRIWPGKYNGIGGHVDFGEDILSAARRELYEEAGLRNININLSGVLHITGDENTGVLVFIFSATYGNQPISISDEGRLDWIPYHKLMEYPVVDDLPVIIPAVIRSNEDGIPFWGRSHYDANGQLNVSISHQARE